MNELSIGQVRKIAKRAKKGLHPFMPESSGPVASLCATIEALHADNARLKAIETAARECRRLDAISTTNSPSIEDLDEEAWGKWWDEHCLLHGDAYAALDAALKCESKT